VPLLATSPEIPGMPRSRRLVHLVITAVPKITLTPEKSENPIKSIFPSLLIFLGFLLIF
jgi:hypothetical protein